MVTTVRDNEAASRFELEVDGSVIGIADYRIDGDVVVLPHTEIARPLRGRGHGATLVQGALDHIRPTGRTVIPRCSYVAEFLDTHPEYRDLVA